MKFLMVLVVLFPSIALADDFSDLFKKRYVPVPGSYYQIKPQGTDFNSGWQNGWKSGATTTVPFDTNGGLELESYESDF